MRVLLVGPDFEDNLSIRYLVSALHQAGHVAELAAFNNADDIDSVVTQAKRYDIVGLSLTFQVRAREFFELARRLKAASNPWIVVGGHYASCEADALMEHHPSLDLVVLHEGEHAICEITDAVASANDLAPDFSEIQGILFRKNEHVVRTAQRRMIEDLDTLPFPDRRGTIHLFAGVPTAYMMGSRGCVAKCDYCCIVTLHELVPGKRYRRRDPAHVVQEMAELYHTRGIRQFIFHDDNFLVPSVRVNNERIDAYEAAWKKHGMTDIGFTIKCRPPDVDADIFRRLKDLGLIRVFFGIESSSSEGLNSIGRRQTVEECETALKVALDLDISAQYTMMCFHPDATMETLRSDIAFMTHHEDHAFNFCRTEIYSGTPLEAKMIRDGRAKGDYVARTYDIADSTVDTICKLALRVFSKRCWAMGGLMEHVIGMDHLSGVIRRFYSDNPAAMDLCAAHRSWRIRCNRDMVAKLTELVEIVESSKGLHDPALMTAIQDLADRERKTRRELLKEGSELRIEMDRVVLPRVGLVRDGTLKLRVGARLETLAPHAASVLMALVAAGGLINCTGVSEFAPPPLEDTDGDGLPDECEEAIFGTDPLVVDSDEDGVLDGDEDHDDDGMTNVEEQNTIGFYYCDDVEPDPL